MEDLYLELQKALVRGLVREHHRAWCRGYVKRGCGYYERYSGRYGKGYIYHYENDARSKNYHRIVYYIAVD